MRNDGNERPFPEGFLWGTATAAHQIEGNNINSDWWHWEVNKPAKRKWPVEPSGIACDSYNRYEEDFDLCKQMNNNAVRISVEWARIEPSQGSFDLNEIEHYKKVLQSARDRGLKTFVTLHHYTSPYWFSKKGGWTKFNSAGLFTKYAEVCAREFSDLTDFFITINEPEGVALEGYLMGRYFPGKKNLILTGLVELNLHRAHNKAYKAMKKISQTPIGLARNIAWVDADSKGSVFIDKLIRSVSLFLNTDLQNWYVRNSQDFLGVNHYFTNRFIKGVKKNANDKVSDMGWWIYPEGLEKVLIHVKRYGIPIYVTESGLADAKDLQRKGYIHDHLVSCWNAIQKGVDLRGFIYWSLLDNYEWRHGFWPQFGLVEIDRENNLERKPRPSFYYYAEICKNNSV